MTVSLAVVPSGPPAQEDHDVDDYTRESRRLGGVIRMARMAGDLDTLRTAEADLERLRAEKAVAYGDSLSAAGRARLEQIRAELTS